VELETQSHSERIDFIIRDNGKGMAPDVVTRVFEPFFTTRSEGTGLGLAIARGVARVHGGGIEVSSQLGQGSEFVFSVARQSALVSI
jgi:two-component system sensor histidine kinase FlrB